VIVSSPSFLKFNFKLKKIMTKENAIRQMQKGKKITHRFWDEDEWMTIKFGKIILEDGCSFYPDDFWRTRKGFGWSDGYSVYKTKTM